MVRAMYATILGAGVAMLSTTVLGGGLGGYAETELTQELKDLLYKSLEDTQLYNEEVDQRVCVTEAISVEQQVVAGMNYRFTVMGCDVIEVLESQNKKATGKAIKKELGKCGKKISKHCAPEEIEIQIFEQSWTDTIEVSKITFTEEDSSDSSDYSSE